MLFMLLGLAAVAYVFYSGILETVVNQARLNRFSLNVNVFATGANDAVPKRPENYTEKSTELEAVQERIFVTCQGGLGNMMFQYASLLGLAKINNMKPYFCCENKLLHESFQLTIPRIQRIPPGLKEVSGEPCCIYKKQLTELSPKTSYSIVGYLQSWKYFLGYFNEIRQEFTFSNAVQDLCDKRLTKILKQTNAGSRYVVVGIHARRGDFALPDNANFGHEAAKSNFLTEAVKLARRQLSHLDKKLIFVIAGDNLDWNRAHLKNVSMDVYFLEPVLAAVDMCVLSKCNSVIMSSGTYGWWSAFLANGRTWYETDFCRPHSDLCKEMKEEDFLLPAWIPFSSD